MTIARGKRKRRASIDEDADATGLQDERERLAQLQRVLRQHFETSFAPLPRLSSTTEVNQAPTQEDGHSATDWEGLSDSASDHAEVVNHEVSTTRSEHLPRHEHKTFMSSKPPQQGHREAVALKNPGQVENEDAETDHVNLKKDLALQRLLEESHLLEKDGSTSHGAGTRHRALDMRFQKLGSKSSVYAQPKMPLAQRVGIATKAVERAETRRREARENGVVLEKAQSGKPDGRRPRQKTIDAPSVGKFRKGMLTLSRNDLREINGSRRKVRR